MGTFVIYTRISAIVAGQTSQFSAENANGDVTWTSSDLSVATVDEKGLAKGLKPSTKAVMIRGEDSQGYASTAELWIGALTVKPQYPAADAGEQVQFEALGATGTVTWSSSVPAVATIDASSGIATIQSLGTTLITAIDGRGRFGYATLRGGTLLVYGMDGMLYMVPAQLWAVARMNPSDRPSQVPTFNDMNQTPQRSGEHEIARYVPVPTGATWTTCYVLNPWSVKKAQ